MGMMAAELVASHEEFVVTVLGVEVADTQQRPRAAILVWEVSRRVDHLEWRDCSQIEENSGKH